MSQGSPGRQQDRQRTNETKSPGKWLTRFGLDGFSPSLALFGLCVFTFAVVTFYLKIGQLGIGIAVVGLLLQSGKLRMSSPVWLFGAFVLWAAIASFASIHTDTAQDHVLELTKLVVILLVVVNALRSQGQIRFYLFFFLACFILFPVRGALMNYVTGYHPFGRALWNYIYNNPNDLASLCLIALGVAISIASSATGSRIVRLASGGGAILLLITILLTQSRGVFLGMAISMGPALVRQCVQRPKLIVLALLVGVSVAATVPNSVWERLAGIEKLTSSSTIAEADPEGSAAERLKIQKVAWEIFIDNPVFGTGLGTYPLANDRYAPALGRKDTHNTYLNLLAEVGLPGFLLWILCFGTTLRYAYRQRQRAVPGVHVTQQAWLERAMVGYLIAGLFGTYGLLTFPYLMLGVLWCSATLLSMPPQTNQQLNVKRGI